MTIFLPKLTPSALLQGMFPMSPFESRAPQFEDNVKAEPRMLSPGYYSQECNAHKPCEKSKTHPGILVEAFTVLKIT